MTYLGYIVMVLIKGFLTLPRMSVLSAFELFLPFLSHPTLRVWRRVNQ